MAMQHGKVSVVASTDAMSAKQLMQYAGQALCAKVSP